MNELIKVEGRTVGNEAVQTVNARELHGFLGSKVRFNDWIKKRIDEYGFIESVDYVRHELDAGVKLSESGDSMGGLTSTQNNVALETMGYKGFGQQGRIEYAITIDMAKELSMVERNEKGKQARQYFLACEKRLKSMPVIQVPQTLPEALRLAADLAEKNAQQAALIEEQKPSVVNGNLKLIQFFRHRQLKFDTPICGINGIADDFLQLHLLLFDGPISSQQSRTALVT